jgi:predicted MFS family arabinose efflux permease
MTLPNPASGSTGERLAAGFLVIVALGVAQGAGSIAYGSLPPLLTHYVLLLHLSVRAAGLLSACFGIGALVGVLPACICAGRNPRPTALAGLLVLATGTAVIAWSAGRVEIEIARMAQGFGDSFAGVGALTSTFQVAPTSRRSEAFGMVNTLAIGGSFLGPALAVAAGVWGTRWVFSAGALGMALLGVSTLWMPRRLESASSAGTLLRSVVRALAQRHSLPLALQAALGGLLATLAPLRLTHAGWSPTAVAVLFLTGAVLGALCYTRVGRRSDVRGERAVTIEILVASALGAGMLALGSRWILAPVLSIDAAVFSLLAIPTISRLYDRSPSGRPHGSSSALVFAIWAIFNVAGALGAASLAAVLGTSLPFVLAALVCLAVILLELAPRRHSLCRR